MSATLQTHHLVRIQQFMKDRTGNEIPDNKLPVVQSRLARRIQLNGHEGFSDYLTFALADPRESDAIIDLLTTHETYFFREKHHLGELEAYVRGCAPGTPVRVWSAACSTGEEPYSIAMTLADLLGMARDWEVLATDISPDVLESGRRGIYKTNRLEHMPREVLVRYCQEGQGRSAGRIRVRESLRQRVTFRRVNLVGPLPEMVPFDVIFLRNVLIYFSVEDQKRVIAAVSRFLKPGGLLLLGKAEVLRGTPCPGLRRDGPSQWRKAT